MQPEQNPKTNLTQAAIHNPIAILVQSSNPYAIGEQERSENIEPGVDPGRFRSPIAQGFHDCTRIYHQPGRETTSLQT